MIPTIYLLLHAAFVGDLECLGLFAIMYGIACVPILAFRKAIFDGYPGRALSSYIYQRWPHLYRLPTLEWEVRYRRAFDVRVHLTPAFYVPRALCPSEVTSRANLLRRLMRSTRWQRRALYLLQCALCQSFWISALAIACAGLMPYPATPIERVTDICLSALVYAIIISQLAVPPQKPRTTHRALSGGCSGGCGKSVAAKGPAIK